MPNPGYNAQVIKALAASQGFTDCAISKAEFLEKEAPRLEKWLKNDFNGEMKYLENHFDMRLDPTILVPGAKSIVSLLFNYYPTIEQNKQSFKFAKYAYGTDYHTVVKTHCNDLLEKIRNEIGDVNGRAFVDSAPIMERVWAEKSGLGWIGKNGLLINKKKGSFFFLAELIIDLECEPDTLLSKDHCGTCNKCVEACPTDAILPNKTLNASHCISYLTIELKNEIPENFTGKMNDWVFGCDICQDVCPWNRFSKPHNEPLLNPQNNWTQIEKETWRGINEETFKVIFKNSPVKRTKYEGLKRNIQFSDKK